jgi:hypothetical protein
LQAEPEWKRVTKTGDIKQKRYNLDWIHNGIPPATEEELEAFFSRIKEDKERTDRTSSKALIAFEKDSMIGKDPSLFLDPNVLAKWWIENLEPSDQNECRMRMRDVYERFVQDTEVRMPKALFGELSVRYVLSRPEYAPVVRKGKIHSKRYSLRWRVPAAAASTSPEANSPPRAAVPVASPSPSASPPLAPRLAQPTTVQSAPDGWRKDEKEEWPDLRAAYPPSKPTPARLRAVGTVSAH